MHGDPTVRSTGGHRNQNGKRWLCRQSRDHTLKPRHLFPEQCFIARRLIAQHNQKER